MKLDEIIDCYPDCDFIKIDDFDDCIIGFDWRLEKLVYSVNLILSQLLKEGREDCPNYKWSDAVDVFKYNIESGIGDGGPVLCFDVII